MHPNNPPNKATNHDETKRTSTTGNNPPGVTSSDTSSMPSPNGTRSNRPTAVKPNQTHHNNSLSQHTSSSHHPHGSSHHNNGRSSSHRDLPSNNHRHPSPSKASLTKHSSLIDPEHKSSGKHGPEEPTYWYTHDEPTYVKDKDKLQSIPLVAQFGPDPFCTSPPTGGSRWPQSFYSNFCYGTRMLPNPQKPREIVTYSDRERGGPNVRRLISPLFPKTIVPDSVPLIRRPKHFLFTRDIVQLYQACNPSFVYDKAIAPHRFITEHPERVANNGYDNAHANLILASGDVIYSEINELLAYKVLEPLGQGTFGQVVKAVELHSGCIRAVKVIKNRPNFQQQAWAEIKMLRVLNDYYDPHDDKGMVRLLHTFTYKSHLCLVFEMLSVNLFEVIRQNQFHGLSLQLIRVISRQLFMTLLYLRHANIIHCDLKPENILLASPHQARVKVIDFGSATSLYSPSKYTYIQSRFYRAPEVILGFCYSTQIDMWSVGCILAELFIGIPLFPGTSSGDLMHCILKIIGPPPVPMLQAARDVERFFEHIPASGSTPGTYKFKSDEFPEPKPYVAGNTLEDIISLYPYRIGLSQPQLILERATRVKLVHLLRGCLEWNPAKRFTPYIALNHPFFTHEPLHSWNPDKFRLEQNQHIDSLSLREMRFVRQYGFTGYTRFSTLNEMKPLLPQIMPLHAEKLQTADGQVIFASPHVSDLNRWVKQPRDQEISTFRPTDAPIFTPSTNALPSWERTLDGDMIVSEEQFNTLSSVLANKPKPIAGQAEPAEPSIHAGTTFILPPHGRRQLHPTSLLQTPGDSTTTLSSMSNGAGVDGDILDDTSSHKIPSPSSLKPRDSLPPLINGFNPLVKQSNARSPNIFDVSSSLPIAPSPSHPPAPRVITRLPIDVMPQEAFTEEDYKVLEPLLQGRKLPQTNQDQTAVQGGSTAAGQGSGQPGGESQTDQQGGQLDQNSQPISLEQVLAAKQRPANVPIVIAANELNHRLKYDFRDDLFFLSEPTAYQQIQDQLQDNQKAQEHTTARPPSFYQEHPFTLHVPPQVQSAGPVGFGVPGMMPTPLRVTVMPHPTDQTSNLPVQPTTQVRAGESVNLVNFFQGPYASLHQNIIFNRLKAMYKDKKRPTTRVTKKQRSKQRSSANSHSNSKTTTSPAFSLSAFPALQSSPSQQLQNNDEQVGIASQSTKSQQRVFLNHDFELRYRDLQLDSPQVVTIDVNNGSVSSTSRPAQQQQQQQQQPMFLQQQQQPAQSHSAVIQPTSDDLHSHFHLNSPPQQKESSQITPTHSSGPSIVVPYSLSSNQQSTMTGDGGPIPNAPQFVPIEQYAALEAFYQEQLRAIEARYQPQSNLSTPQAAAAVGSPNPNQQFQQTQHNFQYSHLQQPQQQLPQQQQQQYQSPPQQYQQQLPQQNHSSDHIVSTNMVPASSSQMYHQPIQTVPSQSVNTTNKVFQPASLQFPSNNSGISSPFFPPAYSQEFSSQVPPSTSSSYIPSNTPSMTPNGVKASFGTTQQQHSSKMPPLALKPSFHQELSAATVVQPATTTHPQGITPSTLSVSASGTPCTEGQAFVPGKSFRLFDGNRPSAVQKNSTGSTSSSLQQNDRTPQGLTQDLNRIKFQQRGARGRYHPSE